MERINNEQESFGSQIVEQRRRAKELGLTLRGADANVDAQMGEKGEKILGEMTDFLDEAEKEIEQLKLKLSTEFDRIIDELYKP